MPALKWQEVEADALEVRADVIEGALERIALMEGMFTERPELRDHIRITTEKLVTEVENLRVAVRKLREKANPTLAALPAAPYEPMVLQLVAGKEAS